LVDSWKTNALGKDGEEYKLLRLTIPVIPIAILLFLCYIFLGHELPMVIVVMAIAISLVFTHQFMEMYRFLQLAAKTVKIINRVGADKVELTLFSDEKIELNKSDFKFIQDVNHNIIPFDKKLFQEGKTHGVLKLKGSSYYLSSTFERSDELFDMLFELSA
jgi:hypothetical protein